MDWTQIILALITLGGTLGGVWLGHRWAEDAARQREAHAQAQQADTVRAIVRLEIEANLATLQAFLDTVSGAATARVQPTSPETPSTMVQEPTAYDLVGPFASQPPLLFERLALESQLSALPLVLTDSGVLAVLSLYKSMNRLEAIHQRTRPMLDEAVAHRAAFIAARLSHSAPPSPPQLHEVGPSLWLEFERLAKQLLTSGNPLRDRQPRSAPPVPTSNEDTGDGISSPVSSP